MHLDGSLKKKVLEAHQQHGAKVTVGPSGRFRVGDFDVAFSDLPWLFKTFGELNTEFVDYLYYQSKRTIKVDSDVYCLEIEDRGDRGRFYYFTKNDLPHCVGGPAYYSHTGSHEEWWVDGELHNLNGPARKVRDGEDKYVINGQIYDGIRHFIESHPQADIKTVSHQGMHLTITMALNYVVIRGGGHVLLLKRDFSESESALDFLVASVYKKLSGYRLVDYEAPNEKFEVIFKELSKAESFTTKQPSATALCVFATYGDSGISLEYNKKDHKVHCKLHEYEPDAVSSKTIDAFDVHIDGLEELVNRLEPVEESILPSNPKVFYENKRDAKAKNLDSKITINDVFGNSEKERKKILKKEKADQALDDFISAKSSIYIPVGDNVDQNIFDEPTVEFDLGELLSKEQPVFEVEIDNQFKQEFAKKFTENLDEYISNFIQSLETVDTSNKVYGVSIPDEHYKNARFNSGDNSYFWVNEQNELHSPDEVLPAVIFPTGQMLYYQNGNLHRESGPAVQNLYDRTASEYWLWGHRVSENEFKKYSSKKKLIEFKDEQGFYHRDDGPAVIIFESDGTVEARHFNHGSSTLSVRHTNTKSDSVGAVTSEEAPMPTVRKKNPRIAKVVRKKKPEASNMNKMVYTELKEHEVKALKEIFREHLPHLKKFEDDIHAAAKKAMEKKGIKVDEEEFNKKEEVKEELAQESTEMSDVSARKKIRSAPDLTGNRTNQVVEGFKFGFKKGVVNNSSHLLAEKIAGYTPLEGNEWFERFLQICLLLGTAEMVERMPEGVAEKMRLSEDVRLNAGSLFRYTSGENIGRDLVDIVANVLPLFAEVLKNVTAEELADLKKDFEIEEDEDSETETSIFDQVSHQNEVEEQVHEEVGVPA